MSSPRNRILEFLFLVGRRGAHEGEIKRVCNIRFFLASTLAKLEGQDLVKSVFDHRRKRRRYWLGRLTHSDR